MKKEHIIKINSDKCVGCGLCKDDCPASNIVIEKDKANIIAQDCIKCGHCVAICPHAAVSMTGFCDPPEEIRDFALLDSDALLKAIKTRRSIRRFKNVPIESGIIDKIIEAGRFTPTGKNAQNVSFIILRENIERCEKPAVKLFRLMRALAKPFNKTVARTEIDDRFFFKGAPAAILIICRDKINGSLAAANMELVAEACGLGVLYSGFFSMAANFSNSLKKELGLKRGDKVVTTLVLGYSSVKYKRTAQRESASVRVI